MLVVLSDTHGTDGHRLRGRALRAVESAELVVHAGDFTTAAVVSAFESVATAFAAVAGNRDEAAVHERLPARRTVTYGDRRVVVVHGHEHDRTTLSLLARQEDATVAIVGHSHTAGTEQVGETLVVNPGSHADPRGGPATHVEVQVVAGKWRGRIRAADGTELEQFSV